jgi:hypothetical protein
LLLLWHIVEHFGSFADVPNDYIRQLLTMTVVKENLSRLIVAEPFITGTSSVWRNCSVSVVLIIPAIVMPAGIPLMITCLAAPKFAR